MLATGHSKAPILRGPRASRRRQIRPVVNQILSARTEPAAAAANAVVKDMRPVVKAPAEMSTGKVGIGIPSCATSTMMNTTRAV